MHRFLLGIGPVSFTLLFFVRALNPVDPTLLGVGVLLVAATVGLLAGSRLGAAAVGLLALALFQPVTARDISFNLSAVDSTWWRWWAIFVAVSVGGSVVSALATVLGRPAPSTASAVGVSLLGLALGATFVPAFAALQPQQAVGGDLSDAELAALPVIEMTNYRYEPGIIELPLGERYLARLDNPSDLPHTLTIDALDVDVYVPAGRWAVVEIDPGELGALEVYCAIGDHRQLGMQAVVEVR